MNHTSEQSLGWKPPLQVLTGQTIDISIMLQFVFWDVVYVSQYDDHQYHGQIGSEKSSEVRGRFVGFAWDVGHALTFKVLTDDSKRVLLCHLGGIAYLSRTRPQLFQDFGDHP